MNHVKVATIVARTDATAAVSGINIPVMPRQVSVANMPPAGVNAP